MANVLPQRKIKRLLNIYQEEIRHCNGGHVSGACEDNIPAAHKIPCAEIFRTNRPSHLGGVGHTVGLVRAKNQKRLLVFDVSCETDPIVGKLSQVHNDHEIVQALETLLGVGGWFRRK